MDNTVTAAAIAGFIAPALIAVINRRTWSSEVKGIVAFLACVVIALGVTWYWQPGLDWRNLRVVLAVVLGTAVTTYHVYWKPSGLAPAIETKTG